MAKQRLWLVLGAVVLATAVPLSGCINGSVSTPAPEFELTDQRGEGVGLGNLRGQVVLLTFLYTHCPDTCPLYIGKISQAVAGMGAEKDVSVVAITVDPERDTVERLQDFARYWPSHRYFLTGSPDRLAKVWQDYSVYVEKKMNTSHHADHQSYEVIHTAKVVLIDREGYLVAELKGDWNVTELQLYLQELLTGPPLSLNKGLLSPLWAFFQRCGEWASAHPWAFTGLVFLLLFPGIVLPLLLFRILLRK